MNNADLLREIYKDVTEIKEILTGGSEPSKGLIVKHDRVEQTVGVIVKTFWVFVTIVATPGAIGAVLYHFISQGKH
jgi:hypothetical protein